ncbi:MAG: hypothetical protein Q9M39_02945 [Sulfurovum sp.]|nr:hypothetical protein [Sulfurovum sp.]
MSELERIEQLEKEIRELKGLNDEGIPTYSFSQIWLEELESLVDIEENIHKEKVFKEWFKNEIILSDKEVLFLVNLIEKNKFLVNYYHKEDLKAKYVIPILHEVDFLSYESEIRDFYGAELVYKRDDFIFNGTLDCVMSKGLFESQKSYFLLAISPRYTDPEPQLLAELISAIELNNDISMRGAYIVGAIWNFVILEKLSKDKYQYFVSENYDSSKIGDLKGIYRNLVFVKEEIVERVKKENAV